eukprot:466503_1
MEIPHYRQSNGYHFCILSSIFICFALLTFFLYSLCIDNLSFIFISFVGLIHAFLISSFAIYQFRKSKITEMIDEDLENGFSLNTISKDDIYDSTHLILTRHKLCSSIVHIANYIDKKAIKSIQVEQRHERLRNADNSNIYNYNQL